MTTYLHTCLPSPSLFFPACENHAFVYYLQLYSSLRSCSRSSPLAPPPNTIQSHPYTPCHVVSSLRPVYVSTKTDYGKAIDSRHTRLQKEKSLSGKVEDKHYNTKEKRKREEKKMGGPLLRKNYSDINKTEMKKRRKSTQRNWHRNMHMHATSHHP